MTEKIKADILLHSKAVAKLLNDIATRLIRRGEDHDRSKLEEPEISTFAEFTPKLASSTYGSDEYQQILWDMSPALDHHYANNRHHPEHHRAEAFATCRDSFVDCMNLVDIMEMLSDWMAASMRHNNGDIRKSIEINKKRFGLTDQLTAIFLNTVKMLEDEIDG